MKILIVDNTLDRDSWGSRNLCQLARLAVGATVYVRRAPEGDLPKNPQEFDKVIISGSRSSVLDDAPWTGQLVEFIKKVLQLQKPYLGVCYGHQILARTLGGKEYVGNATPPEFGWTKIELTGSSELVKGLPSSFYSFSSHFEEVTQLPPSMRSFARSETCPIQGYEHESLPVFGIQFHPEKTKEEANKILSERKKTKIPPILLNPNDGDRLYDPKLGETLFKNFLEIGTRN